MRTGYENRQTLLFRLINPAAGCWRRRRLPPTRKHFLGRFENLPFSTLFIPVDTTISCGAKLFLRDFYTRAVSRILYSNLKGKKKQRDVCENRDIDYRVILYCML